MMMRYMTKNLRGLNVPTFEAHKLDGMVDIIGHGKIESVLIIIL